MELDRPMRIAFLCKRRYMGKDVINDRYGRLYEFPFQLARLGHQVQAFCLDYKPGTLLAQSDDVQPGMLHWLSRSVGRTVLPAILAYPPRILRDVRTFAPDIVIGASDIPHVALGQWLSQRLGCPYVVDLYDNFEGFGQARVPGMKSALRKAVRKADMVLTTSEPLRKLVLDDYGAHGQVIAMPSSVDIAVFHQRDKSACRASLNLPLDGRLVGTAGGLSHEKGIATLYEAWQQIASGRPDVHLVLAGTVETTLPIPQGKRVHYLGMLPHHRVAELFCALDVGVISVLDTAFGRYCFPQKAYEMLACGLPVAAAKIGAMSNLLASVPQCLFRAGDASDLARCVLTQLNTPMTPSLEIRDWQALIGTLEPRLRALLDNHKSRQ